VTRASRCEQCARVQRGVAPPSRCEQCLARRRLARHSHCAKCHNKIALGNEVRVESVGESWRTRRESNGDGKSRDVSANDCSLYVLACAMRHGGVRPTPFTYHSK